MGAGGVIGDGGDGWAGDGIFNVREVEGRSDELEGGRGGGGIGDVALCTRGGGPDVEGATNTCDKAGRDFDRIWVGIVKRRAAELDEGVWGRVGGTG